MIRPLLLPALAAGMAAMLGGCVSGYQYRDGAGDYYYGQPSVQYRDYGYGRYGSAGYGYPGGYGGYGGYYGYPYGYGGYGGYGYPYWRPPVHTVRPGPHDGGHTGGDRRPDHKGDRPPWRNLGDLRPPTPMRVQAPTDSPRAIGEVTPPRRVRDVISPPRRDMAPPPRPGRVDSPRMRAPERVYRQHDGRRIRTP